MHSNISATLRSTAFAMLAVSLVTLPLSGCVFAIGDGMHSEDDHDGVDKADRHTRRVMADLPLGTSLAEVQTSLGDPAFTDALRSKAGDYRVLRYRTQRVHADGETTRDETTPLVFLDGKLVGIGDAVFAKLLAD